MDKQVRDFARRLVDERGCAQALAEAVRRSNELIDRHDLDTAAWWLRVGIAVDSIENSEPCAEMGSA